MTEVLISLASNHEQEKNLPEALQRLGQILQITRTTEAIWTEPVNAKRPDLYLNQLVYGQTNLTADQLDAFFKRIEIIMGRTQELRQQGVVPIDIDLLQLGSERYHLKDWTRDYIKRLLAI